MLSVDEVLKRCCGEEGYRYQVHIPFKNGRYVYATDGRIVVRVSASSRQDQELDKAPPAHELGWNRDRFASDPLTIPDVFVQYGMVPCKYCNHGQCANCKCGCVHSCGHCDGKGEIERVARVDLGPVGISNKYLQLLREGWFKLYASVDDPIHKPVYFTRDDGMEGLVMPMKQGWDASKEQKR